MAGFDTDSWPSIAPLRSRQRSRKGSYVRLVVVLLVLGAVYLLDRSRPTTQIAFVSGIYFPDIYLIDTDGNNLRKLTDHAGYDTSPIWSPDGKYIAFVSDRGGEMRLFLMDADGSNPRQITVSDQTILSDIRRLSRNIAWSPDSRHLVYTCRNPESASICIVRVDDGEVQLLVGYQGQDAMPIWSPDGRQIAFSSMQNGPFDIMVMNADGSNPRNLTDSDADDHWPLWSPDGSQILFVSDRYRDGNSEVYVMDADGSNPTNLTNSSASDIQAVWSPDGSRILFVSDRDGDPEIFIMDADGGNPRNLTSNEVWDHSPTWVSEDRIAFVSDQNGVADIYLIDHDGSHERCLTCPGNSQMDTILGSLARFFGWDDSRPDITGDHYRPAVRP